MLTRTISMLQRGGERSGQFIDFAWRYLGWMALAVRVGRIVLVEASGTRIKPAHHRSFFEAEHIDDPRHAPIELYRRRMPGGTTSVW